MPSDFSQQQLAEVLRYYYENGTYAAAQRAYRDAHNLKGISDCPSRKVIRRCVQNFKTTGFLFSKPKTRKRRCRTTENIDKIKAAVEEDPGVSSRKLAKRFNMTKSTVCGIMRNDLKKRPESMKPTVKHRGPSPDKCTRMVNHE